MLTAFAPPAATLLARLQACVSPERFDEVAVQVQLQRRRQMCPPP